MVNKTYNFVDRTGEIHRGIEIIKELGDDKVEGKCLNCNHTDIYFKSKLIKDKSLCKKCRNGIKTTKGVIKHNTVGKIYGNVKVIEELGGGKVIGKCLICNKKYIFNKYAISGRHIHSCSCGKNRKLEVGKTYNNLEIIGILDEYTVAAKCKQCGQVNGYSSYLIQNGTIRQCMKCTLSS